MSKTLKISLTIMSIFYCLFSRSQSIPAPKVESPNAASLGKFGEVPVSLFTGVPDINIPIHTLSYGEINVPISLRYHSGSVRPAQHPGWVGLGWDLQSIGSVSRKQRGILDEYYVGSWGNATIPNAAFYYAAPNQTVISGSALIEAPDWNTTTKLTYYFVDHINDNPPIFNLDAQADEFSFNFLGYSGKFFYAGPSNGWKVVSDQSIKVELNSSPNDFLDGYQINSIIQQYQPYGLSIGQNQPRVFSGFTLTTPDGAKYIFGGTDAIEFTSAYGESSYQFIANNWLLKKIIDVNKNEVNFFY